eukprot:TRINITY_DN1728_c0_g1_i1.p1 TRINITY_DN1728_c0_g1~~TRINITY_DN1728_c0_g1_i1.p1  ORF type:complete len:303 (-),score=139.44 TRINITY_DN1728_c0_g1_i1:74-982(-)
MAERKAVNKYYPPEWDPSKGSINTFRGQHPLRDRARKLDQGILIVRFEMPYNVWCIGCDIHIGRGVRYNAQKKEIGKYLSTKIYQFRMKCVNCNQWFEIHTDPKNSDFTMVSGLKRKVETWDEKDSETIVLKDSRESIDNEIDPFSKLEQSQIEKAKIEEEELPRLAQLQQIQTRYSDDFSLSILARKKFRVKKKEIENEKIENEKKGIFIPLLSSDDSDKKLASLTFNSNSISNNNNNNNSNSNSQLFIDLPITTTADQERKKRKLQLNSSSIFGNQNEQRSIRLRALSIITAAHSKSKKY